MRRDDRGSAAVIVVGLAGVLVVVAVAGAAVGGLLVGQRRAAAAADLAALAAAEAVTASTGSSRPAGAPCEQAMQIGAANRARMTSCTVEGEEVIVSVTVDVPLFMGVDIAVVGWARAGPVSHSAGSTADARGSSAQTRAD